MNAPGRAERAGITLIQAVEMFNDPQKAEAFFVQSRWPDGIRCPECDSPKIHLRKNRRPQPFMCLDCRKDFSVKTDSFMHASKVSLGKWGIAIYLFSTSLKGVSSMKLHRDLGVTQKTAWHMAHRIREVWEDTGFRFQFGGDVEADETYIGGKEGNKHANKKLRAGRGAVGKTAVVGMKERESKQVKAEVLERTDKHRLQGFVHGGTTPDAVVHTDESAAYYGLRRRHHSVKHSVGEYVRGMCHTNGIESFWAMLKRGYIGVYHHFSGKHCHRYVNEFTGRHNARPLDTLEQMAAIVFRGKGKRLPYADLIAEPPRLI